MVKVIHETKQRTMTEIEFVKPGEFFLYEDHLFVYLGGNCNACDLDSSNHPIVEFEICDVVEIPNIEIKVLKN